MCSDAKNRINRKIKFNHGASPDHIDDLFAMVGIPFITYYPINWQGRGNSRSAIRKRLSGYSRKRNKIAHGMFRSEDAKVSKRQLIIARQTYTRLADRFESLTAENLEKRRGFSPYWG